MGKYGPEKTRYIDTFHTAFCTIYTYFESFLQLTLSNEPLTRGYLKFRVEITLTILNIQDRIYPAIL